MNNDSSFIMGDRGDLLESSDTFDQLMYSGATGLQEKSKTFKSRMHVLAPQDMDDSDGEVSRNTEQ